jgi:hypothetical protein
MDNDRRSGGDGSAEEDGSRDCEGAGEEIASG